MIGYIDIAETSNSDPGQGGSLSPYCKMDSLYFDNSLYENTMHFKLAQCLKDIPLSEDQEELAIHCKTEEEYNRALDALSEFKAGKIKAFGTSRNPFEIIVEEDPRIKHRHFDESCLLNSKIEVE